uniref:glycosyltransferase family 4 protein n=1 Tax=Campylobacter concisus TaxID=199 RepID=UPI00122CF498
MKDKIRLILLNDWLYGGGAERSMAVLANELAKDPRYEIYLVLLENKISFELNSGIKCISFRNSYKFGVFQKLITILLDVFRLIG